MAIVLGGGALVFLLTSIPPRLSTGEFDALALASFFVALFLLIAGAGALVAQLLHQRWPSLARSGRRRTAPAAALRQGVLTALVLCTLAILNTFQLLDPAFFVVTLLMGSLIEAFWQAQVNR